MATTSHAQSIIDAGPFWTTADFPMPVGVPPVPTSVLRTYNDPNVLLSKWMQATDKINAFTKVIEFPEAIFCGFDNGAKAYMAHRFMHEYVHETVIYARDGRLNDRVYLGPPAEFTRPPRLLVFLQDTTEPGKLCLPLFFADMPEAPRPATEKKAKIPRPPNAYILYRKANHHRIKAENPGITNNEISQILGRAWLAEPDRVRTHYKQLSLDAKSQHLEKYPNYQYRPRRPGEKLRRRRAPRTSTTSNINV